MDSKPTGRKYSRQEAQNRFMQRLAEMVPNCYDDLVKLEVLGFPSSAQERDYILDWQRKHHLIEVPRLVTHWMIVDGEIDPSDYSDNVPGRRKRSQHVRANHEWGSGGWITHQAKMTLLHTKWSRDKGIQPSGNFVPVDVSQIERLRDALAAPDFLAVDSFAEARDKIIAKLAELESEIEELIYIPDMHFDYLIRYQVQGHLIEDIAKESGIARSHATSHVNKLANFLWIESRTPPKGRPKGSKDKKPRHIAR